MVFACVLKSRGGVENTRLEAKAKDTKKIPGQGQGQPFRGQTLSRPRTGMLEAKAKDQGHKRKCSPKKKGLHKNFSGDLHKNNVFQKIFQALHKILTIQKLVLSSSRGQANFRGLEASRPRTSSRTPPLLKRKAFLKMKSIRFNAVQLCLYKLLFAYLKKLGAPCVPPYKPTSCQLLQNKLWMRSYAYDFTHSLDPK